MVDRLDRATNRMVFSALWLCLSTIDQTGWSTAWAVLAVLWAICAGLEFYLFARRA